MKRFILLFILFSGFSSLAQPKDHPRFEQIKALRVQFITGELNLTVEEAKVFWPLYDEFKNAEDAIKGKRMAGELRNPKKRTPLEELSDAEIEKILADEIKMQRALIDLREAYTIRFKAILPIRKVAMLFKAEHDFHRRLVEELRGKKTKK